MDGSDLAIEGFSEEFVRISVGERSAFYRQAEGRALNLAKSERDAAIYVEAGWFSEANAVTLTDGQSEAAFIPVPPPE